jgi:hypothetical protein
VQAGDKFAAYSRRLQRQAEIADGDAVTFRLQARDPDLQAFQ